MLALMAGRNARQCLSVVDNGDVREKNTTQTLNNALINRLHSGRIAAGHHFSFAGRSSVLRRPPKFVLLDSWDLVASLALPLKD